MEGGVLSFKVGYVVGSALGMGLRAVVGLNRALRRQVQRLEEANVVRGAENVVLQEEIRKRRSEMFGNEGEGG